MLKLCTTLLIILLFQLIHAQKLVPIDSLSAHIGETIKVCDKVAGTFITKSDKPITYLNLGADYPNTKLTIVIFHKDLINFPPKPSNHYNEMNVCIIGELTTYKDRVQIIATKPDQIEIK